MSKVTEADVLPYLGRNARIEDGLVITSGGAWTFSDYLRRRRYDTKPEVKARNYEYLRRWRERNREHSRAYNREWMRQYRKSKPQLRPAKPRVEYVPVTYVTGSLHDGSCTGPTRATGCRCNKIAVSYRSVEGGRMDRPTTRESA